MISYNQALEIVLESVTALPSVQLPLTEAAGLILATPALARWDTPRWDNSAMDGFALSAATLKPQAKLKIVGAAYAGHPYNEQLQAGEAIRITTGAPLPATADSVIPVEDTNETDGYLCLQRSIKQGQHVRYRGEEYRTAEPLLKAGSLLSAGAIGLLSSAGIDQVEVIRKPRVAIFSTGDELVELGQVPGPGQIINSNLQFLIARVHECGCLPIPLGIGADRSENLDKILDQAISADLIISTGGVSVGEKDLVQETLEQRGFERKFWQVAMKPGKPVLFGNLKTKPCFGLPGNPAATAATFELLVRPALRRMAGQSESRPEMRCATLAHEIKGGGNRQLFLWCRCEWRDNGYWVEVPQRQGSGQTRSVQGANALLSLPTGVDSIAAAEQVEVILLNHGV